METIGKVIFNIFYYGAGALGILFLGAFVVFMAFNLLKEFLGSFFETLGFKNKNKPD
jgi:hypothetical protein